MSSLKILVVGSALGSIKELIVKVKAIDAKHGKFEMVLATGDFFGAPDEDGENQLNELLDGKIDVFTQMYIMQGEHPLPQAVIDKVSETGGQLCHNLYLLSKSGILTTAHGLRIACLGGIYTPQKFYGKESGADLSNPYFTSSLLKQLLSQPSLNPSRTNLNSLSAIKTMSSSQFIDILLTHTWPASIINGISAIVPESLPETAPQLDELVRRAKPRYHFTSCGGTFFEREPFCWIEENNRVSRFVSLGNFGSPPVSAKKERWFYAFSITPGTNGLDPQHRPSNATINPFAPEPSARENTSKRSADETTEGESYIWGNVEKRFKTCELLHYPDECESPKLHGVKAARSHDGKRERNPPDGYVCKICNGTDHFIRECPQKNAPGHRKPPVGYVCRACASDQHYIQDCPIANQGPRVRDRPRGPLKEIQPDECWFCLSNPRVAKHLIVAIGSECYAALPKGQLLPTGTHKPSPLAPVPGGGHILIVPVSHYPTLASIPSDLAKPIMAEIAQFKSALRSCFANYEASPVAFEVSRLTGKGGHTHVQVVPIPNIFSSDDVEAAFQTYGRQSGIVLREDANAALQDSENQNYFRVELPNGKRLIHIMQPDVPFDLQFGRIALGQLLGLPERIDWKACAQSEENESKDAAAFRAAFGPFDPSR